MTGQGPGQPALSTQAGLAALQWSPRPLPFCEGGTEVKRSRQGLALISYQFPVKLTH